MEFELAFVFRSAFGVVEIHFRRICKDAHRVGGYIGGQAITCRACAGDWIPPLVPDYNGAWTIADARSIRFFILPQGVSLLLEILSLELVFVG